ncbi:PAS domain-containing sensor histidine kinase [Aquabacterium sp. OR-4]|uniref:PAS domain-containing sensor histidine kinase n=1 Tax=Aquabacterium sp. OR-4 TaxID=2978127 RepID=UPI0028CA7BCA|nr:ATP-binding protein [Aquabacterium sp. OR-4]MDT7834006.1 ATP-binding protein [Aquabacterium sp. OR-4]
MTSTVPGALPRPELPAGASAAFAGPGARRGSGLGITQENLLLTRALDAVHAGDLETAQALIDNNEHSPVTLGDVFRLYQSELETRAQQLAESQLRVERSLDWFAHLFRALPVAALLVDGQGLIVDTNACAVDELGLAAALRALRLPMRRLLADPTDELRLARLQLQLRDGGSVALDDVALTTPDGRPRWADVRVSRVPAADGAPGGQLFLYVLNDRTARVEAQHARDAAKLAEQRRDVAEAASRAKTDLLSRVSHELRTPLNAVIGFSHLMLTGPQPLDANGQRRLQLIQQAGQHLLALVDEVLQINRAEAGMLVLDAKPVPLLQLAHDAVAMHEPMARELALTMAVEGDPALPGAPVALADSRRTWEVLVNLVSNAVKYNRRGGWVRISAGQDDHSVWLAVADGGLGMTAEQAEHLFEPFNRLGADRLGVAGHGLGLSIARAQVLAMSGELSVVSTQGEGSRFLLRLPRA